MGIGPGETGGSGRGILYAPWERAFERILTPFEEFIHRQTTSGLLLMVSAVLALVLANGPFADLYHRLIHLPLGISLGGWSLEKTLQHWVNDGLMAFFFFVVGMELKREMLVGELADLRQAALPIVAAIGGMVVPALIYLAIAPDGAAQRGWGVPMATDIAFAVGVLALLAARVPRALITFLVALAIVDDLGAVLVIAVFYTDDLAFAWLAAAGAVVAVLVVFNLAGVRRPVPYFLVAVLLWFALLKSGVHATLAGVIGGFTVPALPRYDPAAFSAQVRRLMARFDVSHRPGESILTNDELRAVVQALDNGVVAVQAPLQRLEHIWHQPVAFLVIPVFALFNAGIPLEIGTVAGTVLAHPVALGVTVGLVAGKLLGITGASWVALRLGVAVLPAGTRFPQIAAVSLLAGIGFTMSIFIAELAFGAEPQLLLMAKIGILMASLLSGAAGFACLWLLGAPRGAGAR
ncbi:MAG: Na+/H+ antiporter NhaA [Gammaproteobacteria bacterium]|nr:Na+/H+ antiporter NhaA [Gammaproteobacteria bacterium]